MKEFQSKTTHCSAIIKLSDDFSVRMNIFRHTRVSVSMLLQELYTSHNTWTAFYMMLRVIKHYDLPYSNVIANQSLLSGYFGTLSSTDDFYLLDSGLVVQGEDVLLQAH